ncbi:cell division protein FtsQ [Selenomonas sp. WCT3]|uniref:cell division protein FtsQ/DivIB n=1 Tax=unclassified Selenomonas TaxID=2637378 RepID=UPI00089246E2|nr:FtsQ-type POTRA domain-containing protein [Selenomonas sp.]MCR5440012.1 FtsQ-type POTRA domain-containing protein [Selenomonas sp.]SDG38969.1 cell division protein FtsQ [Selenomonas ruminantium]
MEEREHEQLEPQPVTVNRKVRRSPRRIIKGLLFLLICGSIMGIAIYSPLFTFQRLILNGNAYLSSDDVMDIGRIQKGRPLFQLKTDEITQNLMHDLRIESAVVRRRLPDTIEIDITERVPVATAICDYGYIDFDRQGKVIHSYRSLHKMPIPLITGTTLHDLYIGDDNKDERVAQILMFLQRLNADALNQISEINMTNPEQITAYTTNSVQIRLGNMDRMEEKAKLTQEFLDNLPNSRHPIEYVDFSYTAPFIRLKHMPTEKETVVNANAQ